ncbi:MULTISPECIES: hypothetical protein [Amycolatopsis]|uniref:hypothetical protein n=1 Tax=Amycolatopsis TaxID=1813 RepID=UPI000B8B02FF|nr:MULTISPECIES: hypothetical protein [Amycolatopsis]OXM73717.1 hypothetical protein CF166_08510 [Amycolatopsis sp. KNN50.9b]
MTSNGQQVFSAGYDTTDQTQPNTDVEKAGTTTYTHQFVQSALGITKVTDNGVRTTYARDAKGTPAGR